MTDDALEIRLSTIEEAIKDLKDLNIKIVQTLDRVGSIEQRVADLTSRMSRNSERILCLEGHSNKQKADLVDQIVKIALTALVGFVLVKIGIQ